MQLTPVRKLHASAADIEVCRAHIKKGSKSFFAAGAVMPAELRDDAFVLYAFCRIADDAVDVEAGSDTAVARLQHRLELAYAGRPVDNPVDRALADLIAKYSLPRELPLALLEGLSWDARGVVYENLSDVYAYATRVAGTVGAMMAVLMGVRSPSLVARACDLGIAMQLTNIARDVGEDARLGRLYLPRSWMREAGIDPEAWLKEPVYSAALASVVRRLLESADRLYRSADAGIAALPSNCRTAIYAARYIYHAIGTRVAERAFDSVTARARVSLPRKLLLMGAAFVARMTTRAAVSSQPPLPEAAYIVAAVASAPVPAFTPSRTVADRIVWVAQLFAELDARERANQVAPAATTA